MTEQILKIRFYDVVDIDELNIILENKRGNDKMISDARYEVLELCDNGDLLIKADFDEEEYD